MPDANQEYAIFGCDPGLDMFGFCSVLWTPATNKFRYLASDHLCTDSGAGTLQRCREIVRHLKARTEALPGKPLYVFEKPNECLYGLRDDRLAGVLKLFAVIYAVLGALTERDQIVLTITPADWQPTKTELKAANMSVKRWSRVKALQSLQQLHITRPPFKTKEQDIADAVNICLYGVKRFHRKEWVI